MPNVNALVVIPTYNEVDNINKLIKEILCLPKEFDILVVDDNSPDGTSGAVEKLKTENEKLKSRIFILKRKQKEGLGNAYKAGFKWALEHDYSNIFSMDADFSHNPKYLLQMLAEGQKYAVVIGSRYIKGGGIIGWDWLRYFNSYGANWFTRFALGLKPKDVTAGFKCYSRGFLQSLKLDQLISSGYAFQVEMIFNAQNKGFSIIEIPIIFEDRRVGQSKISGELTRSAKTILQLAWQRESLRQFIKFAIVGTANTVVDWLVYWLIIYFSGWNIQAFKQLAKAFSFIVSATSSYIMNRTWTFQSSDKKIFYQASKFFFIATMGLVLNNFFFYLVTAAFGLRDIFGLIIATGLVAFWNFCGSKYWVFKDKKALL